MTERATSAPVLATGWAAANTQPHREHIALAHLERQGYVAYCPRIRRTIRHARKTEQVLRPLFPGYVFVEISPSVQRWRPILSTVGVRSLVCSGDQPSLLDPRFIAGLRAREVDGAIVRPQEPYELGQQVEIAGGPFDGILARIVEMPEKDRLVVLIDLLNQSVRLDLGADQVSPT